MSINKLFPSVSIGLSFKVLVLVLLCAALVPSIVSQPTHEVESPDPGSESPKEKPSNAVRPLEPEEINSGTPKSELPVSRKPSKPKPTRKSKKNKKQKKKKPSGGNKTTKKPGQTRKTKKPAKTKKPKKSTTKKTPKKSEDSTTESWSGSWSGSSKAYEDPGTVGTPEQTSTESRTEQWSGSSKNSENPGIEGESNWTENWPESSENPEKPETEESSEESSPWTVNWSETSEKSEKPTTEENPEESSTEPSWENTSGSSGNTEGSGLEETSDISGSEGNPEESSTEPSWENTSGSSGNTEGSGIKETSDISGSEGNPGESSTEPGMENTSESSDITERPGKEVTTETYDCIEYTSESSEKTEQPGEVSTETPEESSTEPCTGDMSESTEQSQSTGTEEITQEPCTETEEEKWKAGKIIKGPIAPVFASIGKDGEIDISVIPQYMKHLNESRVAGIVVGGTTGEALSMSPWERKWVLEAWIEEANKYDIKVIAQVGGADEPSVLDMARHAQEVGACGLLLLPQMYYKPKNTEELVIYLEIVSKQAPNLILLYYDFPKMSGVTVNMKELFEKATKRIPKFVGVKSDLNTIFEVGALLKDYQQIYLGNHQIASAVLMGQESSIATINNMCLHYVYQIIDAIHRGDVKEARRVQIKLNTIVYEVIDIGDFHGTMKAAFEMITGIIIGPARRPQLPLTKEKRKRVYEILKKHGIEIKTKEE